MRLLLAEDSLAIQKVIALSFQKSACDVTVVTSLEGLKEQLQSVGGASVNPGSSGNGEVNHGGPGEGFALLICDGALPGLMKPADLRGALQPCPDLKVLILKGSYDAFDKQGFVREGFGHVLAKPFTVSQMVSTVQSLVPSFGSSVASSASQVLSQKAMTAPAASGPSEGGVSASQRTHLGAASRDVGEVGGGSVSTHEGSALWQNAADVDLSRLTSPEHAKGQRAFFPAEDRETERQRGAMDPSAPHGLGHTAEGPSSQHGSQEVEKDLLAAEVYARVQGGLQKEIMHQLEQLVKKDLDKELREIIREELRALADERSRMNVFPLRGGGGGQ